MHDCTELWLALARGTKENNISVSTMAASLCTITGSKSKCALNSDTLCNIHALLHVAVARLCCMKLQHKCS